MHRPIALGSQDMRKGKEGQYITLVTRRTVETNSKAVGHHPEIRVDIAHFTIWFVRVENLGLRVTVELDTLWFADQFGQTLVSEQQQ